MTKNIAQNESILQTDIGRKFVLQTTYLDPIEKKSFWIRMKNRLCWGFEFEFPIFKYLFAFQLDNDGNIRSRRAWQFGPWKIYGPFLD